LYQIGQKKTEARAKRRAIIKASNPKSKNRLMKLVPRLPRRDLPNESLSDTINISEQIRSETQSKFSEKPQRYVSDTCRLVFFR